MSTDRFVYVGPYFEFVPSKVEVTSMAAVCSGNFQHQVKDCHQFCPTCGKHVVQQEVKDMVDLSPDDVLFENEVAERLSDEDWHWVYENFEPSHSMHVHGLGHRVMFFGTTVRMDFNDGVKDFATTELKITPEIVEKVKRLKSIFNFKECALSMGIVCITC